MELPLKIVSAETDFHVARSESIDGFARIERALIGLIDKDAPRPCDATFANKIKYARKLKPSPSFSKAKAKQLKTLLDQCDAAANLRNDLAHAPMQIAVIDRENFACFVNPREIPVDGKIARLLTLDELYECATKWQKIAADIEALQKQPIPPPSPPPPSPVAAGGL